MDNILRASNKRSLWMLNHYAVSPDMTGGTRHFDLGYELAKDNYEVVILASSFNHDERREKRLEEREIWKLEEIGGLKLVWLRTYPYQGNDWRRVVSMATYMYRAYWIGRRLVRLDSRISPPDVIIGSSVHLLAVLSAYCLSRYYHAHFIMEVRDLWPQSLIDLGVCDQRSPVVWMLRWLEWFLYRRAECIITLSPLTEDYLIHLGVNRDKIVYIPNGTSMARFACSTCHVDRRTFKVLYAGSHAAAKDLETAVKAANIVARRGYVHIQFIFVGDGPEKPKLLALAEQLDLRNVRFEEPVARAKVPMLLSTADALLMSENRVLYGSANKLFDYMASGKPIIFAVFAEHNMVEDALCGLSAPPHDPEALADVVIELYEMPEEKRQAMGARGRAYVQQHHDYGVLATRLHRCIEALGEKHA